ncbi:multi-sensor signal transduction histidine kinase [Oscillochloris trichoides DG-6]|uniref:histidine kinase n=1 Tax=Oscillochloris trichoides DG-6 TaxID=765420 RepID=E1IDY1_9CHLR|nr:ATP-binding protein [Oscillochloris trichoides]EFO80592.1 multi-sensor signal transduction histidine kinase [Oscillochloris trichoides DG-6]
MAGGRWQKHSQYPSSPTLINPIWVGVGFGILSISLLLYAIVQLTPNPVTLISLLLLCLVGPAAGMLGVMDGVAIRRSAYILLVAAVGLAFGVIMLSGAGASPLWPALLLPISAALLIMPGLPGAGLAAAIWLAYGAVSLIGPAGGLHLAADWLLRGAQINLIVLLIERILSAQHGLQQRTLAREHALHRFLDVSNHLRVTSTIQQALEEVATAVQQAGDFDCVALCLVEAGQSQVVVAIGASGRRLAAVEGLRFAASEFQQRMERGRTMGATAVEVETLPFRSLRGELHLILPLHTQEQPMRGVISVSVAREQRVILEEALPLLELLANQAAAALDNADLYTTLDLRVQQATADLERSSDDLRRARDQAEVLYKIARLLSVTLDEEQLLTQSLHLIAAHIGAQRGGMMLLDPSSGRLVYRTSLGQAQTSGTAWVERGQGLAGWVMEQRQAAIIPDTTRDPRWQVRSKYDTQARAVLAVPIMLEQEALGVLLLIHDQVGHFTPEHAQLATAAASQAAAALAKAQLYRYISEQSHHLGIVARQREEEASTLLAMLRSIGDGVVVSDRNGTIQIINPAAEAILGITAEAFRGRPISELPGVPAQLSAADAESRLQKFAVAERTVRSHYADVIASNGEILGGVVVYHDMTREEIADRLKTELMATASHELRTPMTSIRGFVDMLMLGTFGEVSATQREPLRVIKNNVVRLVVLIDELLDMSRVEAGEARLRREELDLAEVLRDVIAVLTSQFREREIELHVDFQEGLPHVVADRQRIEQIAVNLIGNACKYTPRGGTVWIGMHNGNGELRVDVRDTGVGISEEAKSHIFTPFYRADNPLRDEVGGTGLGLSITQRLVELHGGRIWFESEVNAGSTFSFVLPIKPEDA